MVTLKMSAHRLHLGRDVQDVQGSITRSPQLEPSGVLLLQRGILCRKEGLQMQSFGAFEIGSAVDSIPIWGSLSSLTEFS